MLNEAATTKTLTAVFDGQFLRPDEPLDLEPNTRYVITIAPQPLRPTDTPKRKYLEGNTSFVVDHLEAGRYRVCAWLEEGSDVDRFLGNPQYEQKFGVSCETVNLAADERRGVQVKQITTSDFR